MKVLLDELVEVGYGRLHLVSAEKGFWPAEDAFRGQFNGMCGAAVPGLLVLHTGLRHGDVGFRIELHSAEPDLDSEWEDVVEVSFTSTTSNSVLTGPDVEDLGRFAGWRLPGTLLRQGNAARVGQRTHDEEDPLDQYLLALWPAPPAADRILRRGSDVAGHFHHTHGSAPTSPFAPSAEAMPMDVEVIEAFASGLAEVIVGADEGLRRSVAAWAALQALSITGLDRVAGVQPAVEALRQGRQVPAPFDNMFQVMRQMGDTLPDTRVPPVPGLGYEHEHEQIDDVPSSELAALEAVEGAALADSLRSALVALRGAVIAHGRDRTDLLRAGLRDAFPQLPG